MVWWRKRSDGFEWHKHVRTTILQKRARRREKIEHVQAAAVGGMKQAGAAGAQAGKAAADVAGRSLASGGRWTLSALAASGRALAAAMVAAGRGGLRGGRIAGGGLFRATRAAGGGIASLSRAAGGGIASLSRAAGGGAVNTANAVGRGTIGAVAAVAPPAARAIANGFDGLARVVAKPGLSITLVAAALVLVAIAVFRLATAGRTGDAYTAIAAASLALALLLIGSLWRLPPGSLRLSWLEAAGHRLADAFGAIARARAGAVGLGAAMIVGGIAAVGAATTSLVPMPRLGLANIPMPSLPTLPSFVSLPSLPSLGARTITGRATALTGDTLRLDGMTVRLDDIEAPSLVQTCERGGGGRAWACGRSARDALARTLRRRDITCQVSGSGGAATGSCSLGGKDLADDLVRRGHVFAARGMISATHASAEAEARDKKRGIWRGPTPERPSAFNEKVWAEARSAAPNGCAIKGRVTGRTKVYLRPVDEGYARARVRTDRGERWFCSTSEAEAAGFALAGAS